MFPASSLALCLVQFPYNVLHNRAILCSCTLVRSINQINHCSCQSLQLFAMPERTNLCARHFNDNMNCTLCTSPWRNSDDSAGMNMQKKKPRAGRGEQQSLKTLFVFPSSLAFPDTVFGFFFIFLILSDYKVAVSRPTGAEFGEFDKLTWRQKLKFVGFGDLVIRGFTGTCMQGPPDTIIKLNLFLLSEMNCPLNLKTFRKNRTLKDNLNFSDKLDLYFD